MRINSAPVVNAFAAALAGRQSFAATPVGSGRGLFAPLAAETARAPNNSARLASASAAQLSRPDQARRLLQQVSSGLVDLRVLLRTAHDEAVLSRTAGKLRPVVETREKTIERAFTEHRNVYTGQEIFETRGVYETQDVYETRDIVETQPVYEDQPIYETHVNGTRVLSSFSKVTDAGIDVGADFGVQVGNGSTAVVKFAGSKDITLTVDGTTTNFTFSQTGGAWRTGMLSALNSISGLTADYTADGKLHLTTSNAQSLSISDVPNGFLDFSGSPLASLGLTAGTTQAAIVGYQQVQVGTEDVVIGTEEVLVGTEEVLVGTEQVKIGTAQVVVGTEEVSLGTIKVAIGTEQIVVGLEREQRGGLRSGTNVVDDDRAAALRSSLADIHMRLSDVASLRAPQFADPSDQDPVKEIATLLNGIDPVALASSGSAAKIADGLAAIDMARARVDAIEADFYSKMSTASGTLSKQLGVLFEAAPEEPQSDYQALLIAKALVTGWQSKPEAGRLLSRDA